MSTPLIIMMVLNYYTDTILPPRNIDIEHIGPDEITFSWSTVLHDGCPSFQYNITSVNCGTCFPSETTSNMSVCTNFNINNVCNFSVSSIICGDLEGDVTYKLVNLQGKNIIYNKPKLIYRLIILYNYAANLYIVPDVPLVTSIPHYSFGRQTSLSGIETSFNIVVIIIIAICNESYCS